MSKPSSRNRNLDRRHFLASMSAGAIAVAGGAGLRPQLGAGADRRSHVTAGPTGELTRLSEHLLVHQGPINVGILRDGAKALLIDCGDASVAQSLKQLNVTSVEQLLFTHHHRDQASGAHGLASAGTRVCVPATERVWFDKVADYWQAPKSRWHLYNQHPHHLMLAEPLRVDAVLADGQELAWGPAKIRVLSTPGHTDGSISLLVEVDGRRVAFCGDAIYDSGQLWDLYSLQKGTVTTDYHGFLGARPQLKESLNRIKAASPEMLVPSHGRIMSEPGKAIDLVCERLDACYDKYVAISALRHYFPKMFREYAGRPGHMPIRPGKPVPACLRHIGTTWVLLSQDKAALVMDCGGPSVVKTLRQMLAKDEIRKIEGLWVTHYHDDHVDGIPAFQEAFDCPCITDRSVAEVITDPLAWRLPCISPHKARVDRVTRDGESWQWHAFKLTAYHLPGQTLYHSGLFVEGNGLKMFFAGDSFTMAGIDDYCMHNRNWLGRDVGFDHCIALIDRLRPTHIFNCHVNDAFDFTPEECRFMRANLAERGPTFGQLVPWDDVNYGMDEPWARCSPYEQKASAGSQVTVELVITNHSAAACKAACRAVLPRAWGATVPAAMGVAAPAGPGWTTAEVPSKRDGRLRFSFRIPAHVGPGRYVIPVDLFYGDRALPQFTEAIVVV